MTTHHKPIAKCAECGRIIHHEELSNLIGRKYYHRYCWITNHTVASA